MKFIEKYNDKKYKHCSRTTVLKSIWMWNRDDLESRCSTLCSSAGINHKNAPQCKCLGCFYWITEKIMCHERKASTDMLIKKGNTLYYCTNHKIFSSCLLRIQRGSVLTLLVQFGWKEIYVKQIVRCSFTITWCLTRCSRMMRGKDNLT